MKVYADTSVFGGYFDEGFATWSKRLFVEFETGANTAVISDITLQELENAPIQVRRLSRKSLREIGIMSYWKKRRSD